MNLIEHLEMDDYNARSTLRALANTDHALPETLDHCALVFETISESYSKGAKDDDDIDLINEVMREKGLDSYEEVFSLVEEGEEGVEDAKLALNRSWSRRARGILLQHSYRAYMFSVTDLLRLRMTNAVGYLREQIESFGLMRAMMSDPSIAKEWFDIRSDQQGRRFFHRTRNMINDYRDAYDLQFAWNVASGSSQHVRFASIALGFTSETFSEGGRTVQRIKVPFQEFQPEKPESLILRLLTILRTQERLFGSVPQVLPESYNKEVGSSISDFRSMVDRLWQKVPRWFPDQVEEWQQIEDER